jgi:hypothetical protein
MASIGSDDVPLDRMQEMVDSARFEADDLLGGAKSQSPCVSRAAVAEAKRLRRSAMFTAAGIAFLLERRSTGKAPAPRRRTSAYGEMTGRQMRHFPRRCRPSSIPHNGAGQ